MADVQRRPAAGAAVDAATDEATRARGRELLSVLRAAGPEALRADAITERVMRWAMSDEALKVQLFRFADVLPMLRGPSEVTRHLREYLLAPGVRLPPAMAALLQATAHSRALAWAAAQAAGAAGRSPAPSWTGSPWAASGCRGLGVRRGGRTTYRNSWCHA